MIQSYYERIETTLTFAKVVATSEKSARAGSKNVWGSMVGGGDWWTDEEAALNRSRCEHSRFEWISYSDAKLLFLVLKANKLYGFASLSFWVEYALLNFFHCGIFSFLFKIALFFII